MSLASSPPVVAPPGSEGFRRTRPIRRSRLRMRLGSRCLFYLMVAMLHVASLLPDTILYWLSVAGGQLAYWLDRRHVRIGLENLSIAFPEKTDQERRRILRASYLNLGRSAGEYVRLGGFFYRRLLSKVHYERLEYWTEISQRYPGRGGVLLTAHFGNFELLSAGHAMHGYQVTLVHHTQRFLAGDALMTFVRERVGVEVLRKHSYARPVINMIRRGEVVGIPFDQNAKRSEAIFVPFFGEPAATTTGLARLVRLADALVLPVFLLRQPDQRTHRIIIRDLIPIQRTADARSDIEENTRRFVAVIEDIARTYPEQFLWTHRRYRTRPRGAAPIYKEDSRRLRRSRRDRRRVGPPSGDRPDQHQQRESEEPRRRAAD